MEGFQPEPVPYYLPQYILALVEIRNSETASDNGFQFVIVRHLAQHVPSPSTLTSEELMTMYTKGEVTSVTQLRGKTSYYVAVLRAWPLTEAEHGKLKDLLFSGGF